MKASLAWLLVALSSQCCGREIVLVHMKPQMPDHVSNPRPSTESTKSTVVILEGTPYVGFVSFMPSVKSSTSSTTLCTSIWQHGRYGRSALRFFFRNAGVKQVRVTSKGAPVLIYHSGAFKAM